MKLELKHIAPYLPYGLKVIINGSDKITRMLVLNSVLFKNQIEIQTVWGTYGDMGFKPILRPLSDLTDPEWRNKIYYFNLGCTDWVTKERETWVKEYKHDGWLNRVPYGIVVFLLENHFDIFGLIEKGLAIDINTINQ